MGEKRTGGRGPITALAMGDYVDRLSRGENFEAAARGAGYSRSAFHRLRKRDPEFAAVCDAAVARSSGKRFIHGSRGRKLQLKCGRRVKFTEERQDLFLAHFAGTANTAESAAEAGVCEATVDALRRRDAGFDRRYSETLAFAYVKLEADLAARRLAAQKRLRDIEPTGEPEPEFDRAMKMLQRWDRRQGPPDSRAVGPGAQERWDFVESVVLLERKLRNMGIPIEPLPPGYERPDGDRPLLPPDRDGGDGGDGEDEEDDSGEEGGQ